MTQGHGEGPEEEDEDAIHHVVHAKSHHMLGLDLSWQNNLVRLSCLTSVTGLAFVGMAVANAFFGTDDQSIIEGATKPLVYTATCAVLLVVAGVLMRARALGGEHPDLSWRSIVAALAILLFSAPLLSLFFVLGFGFILLAGLSAFRSEGPQRVAWQMRGLAVCEFIILGPITEALRHAGAWRDAFFFGRAVVGFYAFGSVLLPALLFLCSTRPLPRLTALLVLGFGVSALHAASMVVSGVGSVLAGVFGKPRDFSGKVHCLESSIDSPATFVLGLIGDSVQPDMDVANGTVLACPPAASETDAVLDVVEAANGTAAMFFFALAGLYLFGVVAGLVFFPPSVKVHDEESAAAMAAMSLHERHIKQLKHCLHAVLQSFERLLCVGIFAAGAVLLVVLCSATMLSPSGVDHRRLQANASLQAYDALVCSGWCADNATDILQRCSNSTCGPCSECCALADTILQAIVTVETTTPRPGGVTSWMHLPADYLAETWCENGAWAPIGLGFLVYCYHVYAVSLTVYLVKMFNHEDHDRQDRERQAKQEEIAHKCGLASVQELEHQMRGHCFRAQQMVKKDQKPEVSFQDTDGRVFIC